MAACDAPGQDTESLFPSSTPFTVTPQAADGSPKLIHEKADWKVTIQPTDLPPPDNSEAVARDISHELYTNDTDSVLSGIGVQVPGILHGTVELYDSLNKITAIYTNPVILGNPDSATAENISHDFIAIGIPVTKPSGRIKVEAVGYLHSGTLGEVTETIRVVDPEKPILEDVLVSTDSPTGRPDRLVASVYNDDIHRFQSLPVSATVAK